MTAYANVSNDPPGRDGQVSRKSELPLMCFTDLCRQSAKLQMIWLYRFGAKPPRPTEPPEIVIERRPRQ